MFTNILDTINGKSTPYFIKGELFLMRTLLEGKTLTLSMAQASDSSLIMSIISADDSFIKLIESGLVKIALDSRRYYSLQEFLLDTLNRSPEDRFVFSSMPYLSLYEESAKSEIYSDLHRIISGGAVRCRTSCMRAEHRELTEEYVARFRRMNDAVNSSPSLDCRLKAGIPLSWIVTRDLRAMADCDMTDSTRYILNSLLETPGQNHRSSYYGLLDTITGVSPSEELLSGAAEIRSIINCAYNKHIASTIPDGDGVSLTVSGGFVDTARINGADSSSRRLETCSVERGDGEGMSWKLLSNIIIEVKELAAEKNLPWNAALAEYRERQRILPFQVGGKYLMVTALTCAISSLFPVIGNAVSTLSSDIIWSAVTDAAGEVMRKPSLAEIKQTAKNAAEKNRLVDYCIEMDV